MTSIDYKPRKRTLKPQASTPFKRRAITEAIGYGVKRREQNRCTDDSRRVQSSALAPHMTWGFYWDP